MFLILTMVLGACSSASRHSSGTRSSRSITFRGRASIWRVSRRELQGQAQLFFSLYFAMTGLHALHMVIGVGTAAVLILRRRDKGRYSPDYRTPVDIAGLYWHFVDIIWIFLFPLLYLIDRHMKE